MSAKCAAVRACLAGTTRHTWSTGMARRHSPQPGCGLETFSGYEGPRDGEPQTVPSPGNQAPNQAKLHGITLNRCSERQKGMLGDPWPPAGGEGGTERLATPSTTTLYLA
ncbi:hypothetical protein NHX12_002695 [Muraenolepis orangiensis]|uniref:Uncharacterized protein n=1 Tax=Muraenolepis orangiensis TaxID=630683 RepID=A0A9Q0DXD1_9TELE|nr:hypothetical protein NHX12_002695 [Muraenolepis orangiensis]